MPKWRYSINGFPACIHINVKEIMESGQMPIDELKIHGIKVPVFYAEIALDAWLSKAPQPERYKPVTSGDHLRLKVRLQREMAD